MALLNAFLALSACLSSWALSAQPAPSKEMVLFTIKAFHASCAEDLGAASHARKGAGPYWILFNEPKGPVVKPILVEASDSRAKILFVLPQKVVGFETFLGLSGAAQRHRPPCRKF